MVRTAGRYCRIVQPWICELLVVSRCCDIFPRMFLKRQLAIVLFIAVLLAPSFSADREPAPRFHAKTMSGESFTNESFKGKVLLLQFWTTWCPYCSREQAIVDDLEKEFAPKGLVVLAVDVGESKKTVKKYLEAHPRACRIVLTDDTNLAAMYAANSYPIYVVVDRDGYIIDTQRGAGGEESLRHMLARAGLESPQTEETADSAE